MTVRKVPVEITTPSPRVAVIKLQRGIQQGLLGRISRDVATEYHGFGIISEGVESNAHYMIAGVQGDWTRGLVNDPPKFVYTREMKVRISSCSPFPGLLMTDDTIRSSPVFLTLPIYSAAASASAQVPGSVPCSPPVCNSTIGF